MDKIQILNCSCTDGEQKKSDNGRLNYQHLLFQIMAAVLAAGLWLLVYSHLEQFSSFFTFDVLNLQPESRLGSAIQFFLYDTPKVFMLLILVIFLVGIIRSFFTPEKTRKILAGTA